LQIVCVDQVFAGDPESPAGHLLDRRAAQVAILVRHVPARILAPLAGVGPAAEAVHRYRDGLVRLSRDRAVGHRAGGESGDDAGYRLDLGQRNGGAAHRSTAGGGFSAVGRTAIGRTAIGRTAIGRTAIGRTAAGRTAAGR